MNENETKQKLQTLKKRNENDTKNALSRASQSPPRLRALQCAFSVAVAPIFILPNSSAATGQSHRYEKGFNTHRCEAGRVQAPLRQKLFQCVNWKWGHTFKQLAILVEKMMCVYHCHKKRWRPFASVDWNKKSKKEESEKAKKTQTSLVNWKRRVVEREREHGFKPSFFPDDNFPKEKRRPTLFWNSKNKFFSTSGNRGHPTGPFRCWRDENKNEKK